MAAEEEHEVPVRRARNDMKRIREDMEEDLENTGYDITTYKKKSPKGPGILWELDPLRESEGEDH